VKLAPQDDENFAPRNLNDLSKKYSHKNLIRKRLSQMSLQEKRELYRDQNPYVKSTLHTDFYIQILFRM